MKRSAPKQAVRETNSLSRCCWPLVEAFLQEVLKWRHVGLFEKRLFSSSANDRRWFVVFRSSKYDFTLITACCMIISRASSQRLSSFKSLWRCSAFFVFHVAGNRSSSEKLHFHHRADVIGAPRDSTFFWLADRHDRNRSSDPCWLTNLNDLLPTSLTMMIIMILWLTTSAFTLHFALKRGGGAESPASTLISWDTFALHSPRPSASSACIVIFQSFCVFISVHFVRARVRHSNCNFSMRYPPRIAARCLATTEAIVTQRSRKLVTS